MYYLFNLQLLLFLSLPFLLLTSAQNVPAPPRLSIPGAVAVPVRPQFRNEKLVRVRRPPALRSQDLSIPSLAPSRLTDDPKPVTESAEDEVPDVFLPTLLREQQLAQAQQAQFQQTSAQFFNSEPNSIQQDTLQLALAPEEQPQQTQPPPITRFSERPTSTISRPQFNDFNIASNSGAQRFGIERPQPTPASRGNVRIRPSAREPRPQFEERNAPLQPQARPRPKPIQSRPVEQNVVTDEREAQYTKRQRPVAQTLRKWREENEDGSITWGYENDDGSFKEEIIGTDCITKGTYGYIDPEGNKREYHYETGILCDPNTRQSNQDLQENGFINYEQNKAVLPNGIEIDMSQLGKKKSRRPGIVREQPAPAPQNQYYRN